MKFGRKLIALVTVFLMVFGGVPFTGAADAAHPYYYTGNSDLSNFGTVKDSSGTADTTAQITLHKENSSATVTTYCCDLNHELQQDNFAQAALTNGHIRAIVYQNLTSLASDLGLQNVSTKEKVAAAQGAIWHFSDGFTLGDSNSDNIKALYNALIALPSQSARGNGSAATVSVQFVSFDSIDGNGRVTMTFRYQSSDSSVSLTPAVSGGNGTVGTPALSGGWYSVSISNVDTSKAFTFSVSGTQSISYDACLYVPQNNSQKLVGLPHSEDTTVSGSVSMQFGSIRVRKVFSGSANNSENFTVTITGTGSLAGKVSRSVTVNSSNGNNNWVTVSGLPFGSYTVSEALTANQQTLYQNISIVNSDTNDNTVTIDTASSCGDVTVSNRKIGSIDLYKHVDTTTSAGGTSFHFTVTGPNSYSQTVDLTDGSDKVLGNLAYGSYTITESAVDNFRLTGYSGGSGTLNGSSYTVTVSDSNRSISVTANNQMLGRLVINKTDSQTGNPVANVTFHIAGPGFTGDKTTDSSGQIVIDHLTPGGSYTVTETSAPADYNMDSGSHPAQTIPAGGTATFNFSDTPVGIIKVVKQDPADSSVKLSGVTFQVSKSQTDFTGSNLVATLTTDGSGTATSGKIVAGTYWIKETNAPSGYVNDNGTAVQITIVRSTSATAANTFTFSDRKNVGSLLIRKTSAFDGSNVAGAQFQVSRNSAFTDLVAPLPNGGKTDASGQLQVDNLVPGPYWVREVSAPANYNYDASVVRNVTVVFAQSVPANFSDTPVGFVRIVKTDSFDHSALAGAVFGVYSDAGCVSLVDTLAATDAGGLALSDPLPFGPATTYYVKEISAPAQYIADSTVKTAAFTAPGQIVELSFANQRNFGDLKVKKVLESSSGDTTSFEFSISGPSYPTGHLFFLTNNGESDFNSLTFGTYVITEINMPASYKLESITGGNGSWDGTSYSVSLSSASQGFTVTATNRKLGSLDITKTLLDGVSGDATPFSFSIAGPGNFQQNFSLASGQDKLFQSLEYGQYTITEQAVPDGYAFASFSGGNGTANAQSWVVNVSSSNIDLTVTCFNHKLGKVEVVKTKNGSTPPVYLAGAVFGIYSDSACATLVQTMQATGADGKATSSWLTPGTYYVKEISAPNGYTIDSATAVQATVAPGETNILPTFSDTQMLGRAIFSKIVSNNSGDTTPFTLHVLGDNGYSNDVKVSAAGPAQTLNDLPLGNYTVTELATAGYQNTGITNNTFSITASNYNGNPIQVVATNRKLLGKAIFSKVVSNASGDSTPFTLHVSGDNGYSNDVTVSAAGPAQTLDDLPIGTYTVTEVSAYGYKKISITNSTFTIDASNYNSVTPVEVTATNEKLFGKIQVTKADAAKPSKLLSGAEFKISTSDTNFDAHVVDTLTTDASGAATSKYLPFDTYWIKETAAPYGYAISSATPVQVTISEDNKTYPVSFSDNQILGKATFSKVVDNNDKDTASFTLNILGDNGYKNSVTVGQTLAPVTLSDLPFGTYTVTEAASTGYQTISIDNGTFTINSDTYAAGVKVTAHNCELPGSAVFSKVVNNDKNDTTTFTLHVSGDNGYSKDVTVGQALAPVTLNDLLFGTYTVTEVATSGYQTVSITNGIFIVNADNYQTPVTVIATNDKELGWISVVKKDSKDSSLYLSGAEFQISTAGGDAFDANVIATITTDNSGTATSGPLPLGSYWVKESKAPAGYVIDDSSIKEAQVANGETYQLPVFTDTKNEGSLRIKKTSSYDGNPVGGVQFQVATDANFANLLTLPNDGKTDPNGELLVQHLVTGKMYWVREINPAPGYDIDRSLTKSVTITFNAIMDVDFQNSPVGYVQLTKLDADNHNTKLAGAVFGVYSDSDCTKLVDTMPATDDKGVALSDELSFGKTTVYYVKEITAPAGYLINTDVQQASFTTPGQIVAMTFTDVKNLGSLVIKKVNKLNPDETLAGAQFTLYSDEALAHQVGSVVTTGSDGIARFDNLTPGTYYLEETKAPKDYDLAPGPYALTVTGGVTNPDPIVIQDQYNPPKPFHTATMDWNTLIIGGLVLLAGLLAVMFTRKRRISKTAANR